MVSSRNSDDFSDEEELEESFDHFSGDENPLCSDGEEDGDYEDDGISSPLPTPPRKRKRRSQDPTSASPESLSPTKRQDRISILCDSLLILILSLLPTKDVVRTGVLSKRWLYLWTSVENISFKYRYSNFATFNKGVPKFISFVDKALVLFTSSDIRKFSLDFAYKRRFAPNVNLWVRFAIQKNVKELELNLFNECPANRYKLPQYVYANSVLAKLNLVKCKIMPCSVVSWESLRALTFNCVVLSEIAIGRILSGSPVLEFLELYRCCVGKHLDINSSSLRKLVIKGHRNPYYEDDSVLEISAPNVSSLEIVWVTTSRQFLLVNVSTLSDAMFDFHIDYDYDCDVRMLTDLLVSTRHVKDLTLGFKCIQVLSKLKLKGLTSPLSERKCLTLLTEVKKCDLPGIASLLQSSCNLETLVIDMAYPYYFEDERRFLKYYNFDGESYWASQERDFKYLLMHLKTVQILGFTGVSCELAVALIQFLLVNAPMLEKMVINTGIVGFARYSTSIVSPEILQVFKQLLSFPRASPQAVITFPDVNFT